MNPPMRIVGVECPHCLSSYESSILSFIRDADGAVVGQHLRCKQCLYSWETDRWGNPT